MRNETGASAANPISAQVRSPERATPRPPLGPRQGPGASGGYPVRMQGRATNFANVLSLLGAFVATSMVMGLLAAGLMMPGGGSHGQRRQVQRRDVRLPAGRVQHVGPLAQQSRILDATGRADHDAVRREPHHRSAGQRVADDAKAQVAIEDSRFYEHGGVDPRGVTRAAVSNLQGRRHPGRVDADPAVRQDHAAGERPAQQRQGGRPGGALAKAPVHAQAPGAEVRDHRRAAAHQGPDPAGLPQPRLLRRPGLRRRGRGPALLQHHARPSSRSPRPQSWPA